MPRDGRPNRERILDTAERMIIDDGYAGTSLDQVIAAAQTSKGAFFHHFASKLDLAGALVDRYAAADIAHLHRALDAIAVITDPAARLDAFIRYFEDGADELMGEQSSCLYVAVLTERQLIQSTTTAPVNAAIEAWRTEIADLLAAVAGEREPRALLDALADHVFVTFEGAFILCRATGDPRHMRRQLWALRNLLASWAADVSDDRRHAGPRRVREVGGDVLVPERLPVAAQSPAAQRVRTPPSPRGEDFRR